VSTERSRGAHLSRADDRRTPERIHRLIQDAVRDAGSGTGKRERLSGDLFVLVDEVRSGPRSRAPSL
jgi:Txe/YoeB family toxin of Txe-Axe toxin-antitoxin module